MSTLLTNEEAECERFLKWSGQVVHRIPLNEGKPETIVWLHYQDSVWGDSDIRLVRNVAKKNGWSMRERG